MYTLSKFYYLFTPYVNADERRVATMFARLSEADGTTVAHDALGWYIQHDVAVLNLWAEYKYKGYDYLTKSTRRKLYENLLKIRRDFEQYNEDHAVSSELAVKQLEGVTTNTILAQSQPEKLAYLATIMRYLSPERGRYTYRKSSSFGRLLQDPNQHVLEGDCNQLVTLYLYLYALKYDVSDMQLVTYPGHVALQFQGVDIETTNAHWAHYERDDLTVISVQEIVSINLLDTTDEYFTTHKIPASTFLEAAKMAYRISSERKLVNHNLQVAYHNAVRELVGKNQFATALKYSKQSSDNQLVETVGNNGAIYYMNRHEYAKARKYAANSGGAISLTKVIDHNEGAYYFQAGKYHEAITAFRRAGEEAMVKRCYEGLFMKEQDRLKNVRTVEDLKAYSGVVHKMQDYAQKSGNPQLIQHVSKLRKSL